MIRYQDTKKAYKIFYGEFFKFPKKFDKNFLSNKKRFNIIPKYCMYDIDTKYYLIHLETIAKKNKVIKKYLHQMKSK